MAFLFLAIGYLFRDHSGAPNPPIIKTGGCFGLLASLLAWYNALAGILDDSNRYAGPQLGRADMSSFFVLPVAPFPWSVKRQSRQFDG